MTRKSRKRKASSVPSPFIVAKPKKPHALKNILLQIFNRFNCDPIDNFHSLTQGAIADSEKKIEAAHARAHAADYDDDEDKQAYLSHLEDEFWQHSQVRRVTGSMLIMGLYHQVETHIKKVVDHTFPTADKAKLLRGDIGCGVDCKKLKGFAALDELRHLNNAVKHDGAVVTKALVKANSLWVFKEELKDLDVAFDRLKPQVIEYVTAFVGEAFAVTSEFETATTQ